MNQRIIYPTDDGGVAVIVPAPGSGLTIQEIAAKDVPPFIERREGDVVYSAPRPYRIVDVNDVPSDRLFRAAWSWQD